MSKSTFATIRLQAKAVRPSGPHYRAPQAEMCEIEGVTDRTLRHWAERGMPVETDAHGRTVYPMPGATIWARCYRALCRESPNGRGPHRLGMQEVRAWHLARQFRDSPEDFVVVPLDWDHPLRDEQLRRAAAGREPPPEDAELVEDSETEVSI